MEGKRYNLRSVRREIHLPIQLQMGRKVLLTDLSGTSVSDIDIDELEQDLDMNCQDQTSLLIWQIMSGLVAKVVSMSAQVQISEKVLIKIKLIKVF